MSNHSRDGAGRARWVDLERPMELPWHARYWRAVASRTEGVADLPWKMEQFALGTPNFSQLTHGFRTMDQLIVKGCLLDHLCGFLSAYTTLLDIDLLNLLSKPQVPLFRLSPETLGEPEEQMKHWDTQITFWQNITNSAVRTRLIREYEKTIEW